MRKQRHLNIPTREKKKETITLPFTDCEGIELSERIKPVDK